MLLSSTYCETRRSPFNACVCTFLKNINRPSRGRALRVFYQFLLCAIEYKQTVYVRVRRAVRFSYNSIPTDDRKRMRSNVVARIPLKNRWRGGNFSNTYTLHFVLYNCIITMTRENKRIISTKNVRTK